MGYARFRVIEAKKVRTRSESIAKVYADPVKLFEFGSVRIGISSRMYNGRVSVSFAIFLDRDRSKKPFVTRRFLLFLARFSLPRPSSSFCPVAFA